MRLETERLIITEFDLSMAENVHQNSLDEDTKQFVPDEVFGTVEDAKVTLEYLIRVYQTEDGPLVYPILLKDQTNIGYVQFIPLKTGFEVGYHIAKKYTHNGYATEALRAFLADIMPRKQCNTVYGICVSENKASRRVLEKCGFIKEFEGLGMYQGKQRNIARYCFTMK